MINQMTLNSVKRKMLVFTKPAIQKRFLDFSIEFNDITILVTHIFKFF